MYNSLIIIIFNVLIFTIIYSSNKQKTAQLLLLRNLAVSQLYTRYILFIFFFYLWILKSKGV